MPSKLIDTALVLVAGRGSRLEGLTDHLPKCLLPIHRVSILERMLNQLVELNFKECYLVTGYRQDEIVRTIGPDWKGMAIRYIYNDRWESANNILSLEIGTKAISRDFLLIEGDLIVKTDILSSLLTPNRTAVCRYAPPMNGTVVALDAQQRVCQFYVSKEANYPSQPEDFYKTINLYSFGYEAYTTYIGPALSRYIAQGNTQAYYESAIAYAVDQLGFALQAEVFGPEDWAEVDTLSDLVRAEELFG